MYTFPNQPIWIKEVQLVHLTSIQIKPFVFERLILLGDLNYNLSIIVSDRLERKSFRVKVRESQELIWILEAITILPAAEIPGSLYGRLPFAYKHRTMAWKLVGGDF